MTILLGIVICHVLVLFSATWYPEKKTSVVPTLVLTVLLVAYVVYMMFTMPVPQP